jgi:hypothetical protein
MAPTKTKFRLKSFLFSPAFVALLFFIVNFATLSHYGVNWDEPYHFSRGQAYLHYFSTGNKDYSDLKPYTVEGNRAPAGLAPTPVDPSSTKLEYRRSIFQHDQITVTALLKEENGHPPLNDIFAAALNRIFYGWLGVMGDIESHHLFSLLAGALLVLVVGLFARSIAGTFAGFSASLAAGLFPLLVAESHFNVKDPPLAAFFALLLFGVWKALTTQKFRWWFVAAAGGALGLGTKFNILFTVPIVAIWLVITLLVTARQKKLRWNRPAVLHAGAGFLLVGAISLGVLYATWPFLWQDPIPNLLKIIGFYQEIGTTTMYQPAFLLEGGVNLYPLVFILITTPLAVIIMASIGAVSGWRLTKSVAFAPLALVLIWLFVTVARVMSPGSAIYGGVRQIAEFIPALAILAGIGIAAISEGVAARLAYIRKGAAFIVVALVFIPTLITLIRLHPNENVFFNSIVGGVNGARAQAIPSVGNTYGNAYYQGIAWLNQHAEQGARFGLANSTMASIPRIWIREDIQFANHYWSGPDMLAEYEIELNYDGLRSDQYSYQYLTTFLNPVWELEVDGVVLLRIWKNDREHARYPEAKMAKMKPVRATDVNGLIQYDLGREVQLARVDLTLDQRLCPKLESGFITTSRDGVIWERQSDNINDSQPAVPSRGKFEPGTYTHWIALTQARYIRTNLDQTKQCTPSDPTLTAWEWQER